MYDVHRGLKTILHDEIHWLDVPERIEYKLGVMVYRCLHELTPRYLADHLIPASDAAPRCRCLRSANRGTVSLCLAVDSARAAVRRSTTLARQSGTRCQMNLETRTAWIVLNGSGRQYFSWAATSVTTDQCIRGYFLTRCAIYIYVLLTYLLIYDGCDMQTFVQLCWCVLALLTAVRMFTSARSSTTPSRMASVLPSWITSGYLLTSCWHHHAYTPTVRF